MGDEREQTGDDLQSVAVEGAPDNHPESISRWPEPTVLTWNDLVELPRQILPPETYTHMRNAGKEVLLAVYSLWRSMESSSRSAGAEKSRRRIDVE